MAPSASPPEPTAKTAARRSVRALWSGTISFGLVNVPVHLFPAVRRVGVSFRSLDQDGTPLQRRYYCPQDKTDVHPEHILRGYPLEDDRYVIIRDDELEAVEPKKSREIDLRRFVDLNQVAPMFFNRPYFLTPRGDSNKAYRLLARTMEETARAGIATFVMRDREHLIAILAERGILRAQTLRFEDELRDPADVGLPTPVKVPRSHITDMGRLISQHRKDQLDTTWMEDRFARRVQRLAESKQRRHRDVVKLEQDSDEPSAEAIPEVDLLETIRRSLHPNGQSSSDRHSRESEEDLKNKSKNELYERAQQLNISGRSRMNKQQLIHALQQQ